MLCCSFLFYTALVFVIIKLYIKLTTGWCRSQVCLKGKTVIVTGANTGIGYETAIDLAKRGAKVILACRSEERAREARDKIIKATHNDDVHYKIVDFASLMSVRKFAQDINDTEKHLDILINNAGAQDLGKNTSEDGLELLMQVNYFAPVLLTHLLLDLLKKSSGRIINLTSLVAKNAQIDVNNLNAYAGPWKQYNITKLCNLLYTIELAARLKGTNVTTYSVHPGIVRTEFLRSLSPVKKAIMEFMIDTFLKNSVEGAQTSVYCAVENDLEKFSGEHFHDCHVVKRYKSATDPLLAKTLWDNTMKILKLK